MKDEPEIVKELREAEKLEEFHSQLQTHHEELQMVEDSLEDVPNNTICFIETAEERKLSGNTTNYENTGKELKNTDDRFQMIFENVNDVILYVDRYGKILDVNKRVEDVFGYKREEVIGKNFTRIGILRLKDIPGLVNLFRRTIRDDKAQKLVELELKHKNGDKVIVEVSTRFIKENGNVKGVVNILRDITERKKIEKELKESEEKYRNLVELAPDAIISVNLKGVVTSCNNAALKMVGYSLEEYLGKHFSGLGVFHKRDLPKLFKMFINAKRGKPIPPYEFQFIHKDGTTGWAEGRYRLQKKDGKTLGFQAIIRDITERKKIEGELEEAYSKLRLLNKELEWKVEERTADVKKLLRQKDAFINQLGHDLRTPLTPLVSLLPILEKTEDDPKSKELIEILHRNADRMKNIVVKTIELAQLNAPSTVFDIKDINLCEEAGKSIKDQQLFCDEKDFTVENKIDENIFVKADKLRLEELFGNLINNAVKYGSYGGTITVDAHEDGDFVTVSIMDSGVGMTNEQIDHIFEEFYKADESRHDFDSSGLGLSICKRIVEKHGGKIWAGSPGPGKGSTFYFTVPKCCRIISEDTSEEIDKVLSNIEEKKGET